MSLFQLHSSPVPGQDLASLIRWARSTSDILNEIIRRNASGAFFVWNKGCVNVPTSTTIDGAEEIVFESPFSGNGTLIVTGVGFEGGVHVALNGTDLGSLSDANTTDPILYEVQVTNLIDGLNSFKIWSTSSDTGELRRLEAWRNFNREEIDTAGTTADWGSVTGVGKPEDNADVTVLHSNAIDNPSFEAGDTGWTKNGTWEIVESTAARLGGWVGRDRTADTESIFNDSRVQVEPGDRVLAYGFMRLAAGGGSGSVVLRYFDSLGGVVSTIKSSLITLTSSYQQARIVHEAPSGVVSVTMGFDVDGGGGTLDVLADGAYMTIIPKDADIDALQTTNNPKTGTDSGTLTGFTTTVNVTWDYTRTGGLVTLKLSGGAATGTSNAGSMVYSTLAADLRPSGNRSALVWDVIDDGVSLVGRATVTSSGTIAFLRTSIATAAGTDGVQFANFASSGTKGLGAGLGILYSL